MYAKTTSAAQNSVLAFLRLMGPPSAVACGTAVPPSLARGIVARTRGRRPGRRAIVGAPQPIRSAAVARRAPPRHLATAP